jgi:hypothetical protein
VNWKGDSRKHHGLIEAASLNLPRTAEESLKKLGQDTGVLGEIRYRHILTNF